MEKNLSERIAERAMKKKPSRNAKNRAQFLAVRSEVKQAMDDGWSVKEIWATLHEEEKITFSYQAFLNHVNVQLLSACTIETKTPATNAKSDNAKKPEQQTKNEQKPAQIPGFNYNPIPNKEELY